jgi:ketosteroid isomerase-like protein
MANDKAAIGKLWRDTVATPGFAISWQATQVGAASSGDMGYSAGTYQSSMKDAKGKPTSDHGKYATVWRKEADGSWKVVVDIFNTDMPAAK